MPWTGSSHLPAWKVKRRLGSLCSPRGPTAPIACWWTPCACGPFAFFRVTRKSRTKPWPNSGATSWPASGKVPCRSWLATTGSVRWCLGSSACSRTNIFPTSATAAASPSFPTKISTSATCRSLMVAMSAGTKNSASPPTSGSATLPMRRSLSWVSGFATV